MKQNRPTPVKTLLWDVDGTLLNFAQAERRAFQTCLEQFGAAFSEERLRAYAAINDAYWKRLELGEVTKTQVYLGRFADFFRQAGLTELDPAAFNDRYQAALGEIAIVNDDSVALCRALRGQYAQYVVTNGGGVAQRGKLMRSGLDRVMDGVFISEELGFAKPDVRFFARCFAQIPAFRREETVIIGDSLTSDMRGGNNAGIRCCWYNPAGLPAPADLRIDGVISDLRALPALLDELSGHAG